MAIQRRNYYVTDEFGDVWNEEPFPTFLQAFYFRGMIKPLISRVTELRIKSSPRGMAVIEPTLKPVVRKKTRYANSEF